MGSKQQPERPVAVVDLKAGGTVRIVVNAAGARRYLFWLSIGRDGSVYLGLPGVKSGGYFQSTQLTADGDIHFEYADATPFTPEQLSRRRYFSHHPSGQVNSTGLTTFGDSWRQLDGPLQLFLIVFEDLGHYPPASGVRLRDIELQYTGDGTRPLTAKVVVAPAPQFLTLTQPEEELGVVFRVTDGLVDIGPLHLHLLMGGGPAGEWPPQTIVGAMRKKSTVD